MLLSIIASKLLVQHIPHTSRGVHYITSLCLPELIYMQHLNVFARDLPRLKTIQPLHSGRLRRLRLTSSCRPQFAYSYGLRLLAYPFVAHQLNWVEKTKTKQRHFAPTSSLRTRPVAEEPARLGGSGAGFRAGNGEWTPKLWPALQALLQRQLTLWTMTARTK